MMKVLLIEDDPWLADSYRHMLVATGECDVEVAHSGEQAVEAIDERLPDVIVADFILGDSNILALLHELQSYGDTVDIPVVLCSAVELGGLEDQTSLDHYGVHSVLDKSKITPDDLRAAVKVAIRESRT